MQNVSAHGRATMRREQAFLWKYTWIKCLGLVRSIQGDRMTGPKGQGNKESQEELIEEQEYRDWEWLEVLVVRKEKDTSVGNSVIWNRVELSPLMGCL